MPREYPEAVIELARELPEYQSSRGAEFRDVPIEKRYPLARILVIARSQASNEPAEGREERYNDMMNRHREIYYHRAGELDIGLKEARAIWGSVVDE